MKLKERESDGVVILEASGRIMSDPDAALFGSTLESLIREGRSRVIVDLGQVTWISSRGLEILISGYTTLKRENGAMKLLNVSDRIESLFSVTNLHSVSSRTKTNRTPSTASPTTRGPLHEDRAHDTQCSHVPRCSPHRHSGAG